MFSRKIQIKKFHFKMRSTLRKRNIERENERSERSDKLTKRKSICLRKKLHDYSHTHDDEYHESYLQKI